MAQQPSSTEEPLLPKKDPSSLDDIIERHVGEFGQAQFLQALLVSSAWIFDAQYTFINVFSDAEPKWHCTDAGVAGGQCRPSSSICTMDSNLWAWNSVPENSIVSQWNLTCLNPVLSGLAPSCFFMGCLVGGLVLATLADSTLGRKKMLFLSTFTMALTGFLTAAAPNIWFYSALRFICGFARATVGTCALVLSTEFVGKRWRGEVGIVGFFCFTLGFLSLPASAYLLRNQSWRFIYLFASIPTLIYAVLVHFFVFESPRWLIVKGREDEAIETLKRFARKNGKPDDFTLTGLSYLTEGEEEGKGPGNSIYAALMVLYSKTWAFRRLTAVMLAGFGIGLVYYGMPLAVGDLDFNLYLSVTLNALSELPSALVTFFLISRLNRRTSVLAFTSISGVLSIVCVTLKPGVQMIAEVVSFFCACTAFNVMLIYCLELFPTSVRNSALSMLRQALVLGGVFSPMLVVLGRTKSYLCFGAFGFFIVVSGLFVVCLPETRGCAFCDTMEEQECRDVHVRHDKEDSA